MNGFFEKLTGIKPPYSQAGFFETVAGIIFLTTIFWPHLSIANLIKGLLIGSLWAVYGFVSYLQALGKH
jgi:hypothetical protein